MDSTTFEDACILTVEADTNCPQGGDSGHGGVTRISLINDGCNPLDVTLSYDREERRVALGEADRVDIEVRGDREAEVLADALAWASVSLRRQLNDNQRAFA